MNLTEFVKRYPPEKIERWPRYLGDVIELRYAEAHLNVRPDGWQAIKLDDAEGGFCLFRWPLNLVDWPWNWFRCPWKRCAKFMGLVPAHDTRGK